MIQRPILPRALTLAAISLAGVLALGTVGYHFIEGWGWFDSFYVTVTNITTVGGGEPTPPTVAGKWWTILTVAVGFGVLTYTVLALFAYVVEGGFARMVEERQIRRRVRAMRNHFILCGYGRVGREIAHEFADEGTDFVVVDSNEDSLGRATSEGHTVVHGDAANVDTLKRAGIDTARGLVTAVDSDPDNIYVTLSARVLRPDLFIVARANSADSEPKLRLAGANRVVSPYAIGGRRLASLAMRPTAVEFVDTVLSASNSELLLEDFTVGQTSRWAGKPLGALISPEDHALVLAIKRAGAMLFRPPAETPLLAGDELVVAGPSEAIRAVEQRL